VRVGLFLGLFSGLVLAGTMPAMAQEDRLDFARGEIALVGINDGTNDGTTDGTNDGRAVIAVEFARNEAERRQGLMYREELAAGTGMLFIFAGEGMRGFWMKNTLIALDMVFFDSAGRFVSLHRDVPPLTLASLQSAGPAQYVLELNAGEAKQLGIGPETRLVLPVELPPELPPELPVELVPEE
jgi:uncharacterized membrane protein (UPF0127 family)